MLLFYWRNGRNFSRFSNVNSLPAASRGQSAFTFLGVVQRLPEVGAAFGVQPEISGVVEDSGGG